MNWHEVLLKKYPDSFYHSTTLVMQVFTLKEVMQYIDSLPANEYDIPF